MNKGATTLLSIKWVDTEQGPKGRGAPTGCAGAVPKSLPSGVARDSEGSPEASAQPRAGAGGALRKASCARGSGELFPARTHARRVREAGGVREPALGGGCRSSEGPRQPRGAPAGDAP